MSLGFWGMLLYAFGYLMWLAFVAAVVVAPAVTVVALAILAVAGVLLASAYGCARDPSSGSRARVRARLARLWLRINSWSDPGFARWRLPSAVDVSLELRGAT